MGKHTKGIRGGGKVLEGIARLAIRAPRRIIAIALLVMAGAAVFGIPVANEPVGGRLRRIRPRIPRMPPSCWPVSSIRATCRC